MTKTEIIAWIENESGPRKVCVMAYDVARAAKPRHDIFVHNPNEIPERPFVAIGFMNGRKHSDRKWNAEIVEWIRTNFEASEYQFSQRRRVVFFRSDEPAVALMLRYG